MIDPVALTAALVRCPSVTPEEGGALALIEAELAAAGFRCTRISRGGVENLYARWGSTAPVFAFAGHTDVVPVGREADWSAPPFGAESRDGRLIGRGTVDMKSGVAAFVSAACRFVAETPPAEGSIALLITGDEEGPATDGTAAILDWMAEVGEEIDFCLVGEPTSLARVGDQVKIGRRGSMTGVLTVEGKQGHAAYPENAENPLPALARISAALAGTPLDFGSTHFQASTLALTTIDVGNPASNVIPASGRAVFNIRFNDLHTPAEIRVWAEQIAATEITGTPLHARFDWAVSGDAFFTPPEGPAQVVIEAITERCLERPALSTGGGTSDARFIKAVCPVVEFGLVGEGMHAVDENVPEADIALLAELYGDILHRFFGV
ncbi:MAG: succinyl-diaminopimelate desuccinylase [Pseudomonadota bacterium]